MASDHPPATHEPDRPDKPPPAPPPPPETGPEPLGPGMPVEPDHAPDAEKVRSGSADGEGGDPTEVTPDPGMLGEG